MFCVAFALVTWQWRSAVVARGEAETQTQEARRQKSLAEKSLDDALQARYRSGISRAEAVARTSPQAAVSTLENLIPADDQPDRRGWEWGYLRRLAQQSDLILPDCGAEQAEWIRSLAFSADESLLAVGAGRTGFTLPRNESPQGRVTLWNLQRGELVRDFPINDSGYSLAISDDKTRLAICEARASVFNELAWSGPTWLWDIGSAERRVRLEMPEFTLGSRTGPRTILRVKDLVFYDSDSRVIGTIWSNYPYPGGTAIWDTSDGSLRWFRPRSELIELDASSRQFLIADYPPDGRFQNKRVDLDSLTEGASLDAVLGTGLQPYEEFSVGMVPNAKNRPYLHDVQTDQKRLLWGDDKYKSAGGQGERPIHSTHPSEHTIAIGGSDGTVRLWQTQTGELQRILYGHGIDVQTLKFSRSGRWLASGDWNGEVRVWQPKRFAEHVTCKPLGLSPTGCYIEDIAFRLGGSGLVSCGYIFDWGFYGDLKRNSHLTTYEPHSGRRLQDFELPPMRIQDRFRTVKFSHDGRLLATISRDQTLRVQRVSDQEVIFESPSTGRTIRQVAVSDRTVVTSRGPDGTHDENEQIIVHDIATGKVTATISVPLAGAIAISLDGQHVAFACSKGDGNWTNSVRYHSMETDRTVALPLPPQNSRSQSNISAMEFREDGLQLAVAWENGWFGIYDLRHSRPSKSPLFRPADIGVTDFAWHPSGKRLAGVNRELVTLWNSEGETLLELRGRPRSSDMPFDATVTFSPDGSMLAATQWDNSIRIWKSTDSPLSDVDREGLSLPAPSDPTFMRMPREASSLRAINKAIEAEPENPWNIAARGLHGSRLRGANDTRSDYVAAKRMLAGGEPCLFLHGDAFIEAPSLPLHQFGGHTLEAWVKHWNYRQPGQVYGVIACQYPRLPRDYFTMQTFARSEAYDRFGLYWLRPTAVYRDVRNAWSHIAVCFKTDGRLYFLNGKQIAKASTPIPFPEEMSSFLIGATPLHDPQVQGRGLIRSIRISEGVRYEDGAEFTPDEQLLPDENTLLQFDFTIDDGLSGSDPALIRDRSGNRRDGKIKHAWWFSERTKE
ncbi:MAG: hypothetical protein AAFU85_27200 [Planctomycetota bacterium]